MANLDGVWRTVGGRRIFIKDGQSLSEAMIESGKFNEIINSNRDRYKKIYLKKEENIDKIVGTINLDSEFKLSCSLVYEKFKENNNENLLIIDEFGKVVGNINTNNEHSKVGYSKEQEELLQNSESKRKYFAIHNHPGNSTFSPEDIYEMVKCPGLCGIIVTTDYYNYYLKPKLEDLNISQSNVKGFIKGFEERLSDINDKLLEQYPQYSNQQLQHMAYDKLFKEIGWKYGRQEK